VGRLLDDQLGASLAEDQERDLVRHRRGREVDGLLLAEQLRPPALQLENGRVLPGLLVPHLRARHRGAHRRRRPRLGVRAKIDHFTAI
jgi:hypothetical protein